MRSYHLPELVWAAVLTLAWLAVSWCGGKVWETWQRRMKRAKGEIVSIEVKRIEYSRSRVVCDGCGAKYGRNVWARSLVLAEEYARAKGWYAAPLGAYSDLIRGGTHYCPPCAKSRALTGGRSVSLAEERR